MVKVEVSPYRHMDIEKLRRTQGAPLRKPVFPVASGFMPDGILWCRVLLARCSPTLPRCPTLSGAGFMQSGQTTNRFVGGESPLSSPQQAVVYPAEGFYESLPCGVLLHRGIPMGQ